MATKHRRGTFLRVIFVSFQYFVFFECVRFCALQICGRTLCPRTVNRRPWIYTTSPAAKKVVTAATKGPNVNLIRHLYPAPVNFHNTLSRLNIYRSHFKSLYLLCCLRTNLFQIKTLFQHLQQKMAAACPNGRWWSPTRLLAADKCSFGNSSSNCSTTHHNIPTQSAGTARKRLVF